MFGHIQSCLDKGKWGMLLVKREKGAASFTKEVDQVGGDARRKSIIGVGRRLARRRVLLSGFVELGLEQRTSRRRTATFARLESQE